MPQLTPFWKIEPEADLSEAIQWGLLDSVTSKPLPVVMAAAAMCLVSAMTYFRTGSSVPLIWAALAIATCGWRLRSVDTYRSRPASDAPIKWRSRFARQAWATAALWGAASFVIPLEPDAFLHFLVITVQTGFLIGAAARNSAIPKAAHGQIFLTLAPLYVACLMTGDLYYICYSLFTLMHFLAASEIAWFLGDRVRLNFSAKEAVADANAELQRANAKLAEANDDLQDANQRLEALATTDGLTGITNRRGFDALIDREFRRARRDHHFISLLMIDIDYFKRLNDSEGHPAGDDCLRRVAGCLQGAAWRPDDIVARYGGEEFAVILPDTDPVAARQLGERLREAIEALALSHPASPFGVITVSIGMGSVAPGKAAEPGDLVKQADQALYAAKMSGRNRVNTARQAFDNASPMLIAG